jgi:iron complex outermembrane receptor protein
VALVASSLSAQEAAPAAAEAQEPASEVEDIVVVTASRVEQSLHEAPATISVLTAEDIANIPADDYGDLLRNVPGLNVSQMSARDIQISGRTATNSLATTQLVLVDSRTIYLDFFGFVAWDFLPVNPYEIKQIEVVRGPGSAVWGANAFSGVVNLITKSPRDLDGTAVLLGGGELGSLFGSVSHAGVREKFGYKVSAAYSEQDPYDRPTGLIPGTSTPYPTFANTGTSQPKLDLRFDYDSDLDTRWIFGAGYAQTDGIIHSGIGPFDISEASLAYAKAEWSRQAMRVGFFTNLLDGDADNLLTVGANGRPIPLGFDTKTYNLDFGNTNLIGTKNILTYGVNARRNQFELSLAPDAEDRDELGLYVQDEILFNDKLRWVIGARVDDLDPIGTVVSPRTSLAYSPTDDHTFRISYNKGFRAPSAVNSYLDIVIVNRVVIPTPFGNLPFIFPTAAQGNDELEEEKLDAYEIGWVGTFDRTTVTVAAYRNVTEDVIDFATFSYYSAQSPPPGWPLPAAFVPPNTFPSAFRYRNIGKVTEQGVELSLDGRPNETWSWFFNYSWQDDADVEGIPVNEYNVAPEHRMNLGLSYDLGSFFANLNVNYADDAFWTDVLDARFHGPTDSYTQLNLGFGVRLLEDTMQISISGQNITDEDVQQHVFGDIISRKITGQVSFRF